MKVYLIFDSNGGIITEFETYPEALRFVRKNTDCLILTSYLFAEN